MRAAISVALFLMLGASAQSQANSAVQNNSSVTSGGAGIALLQSASWDASDSNWATLQFSANNTAGNFIAVVIQGGASGEAFTVTDSQGDTYQQAIQTNEDNARETIAIYYATNIAGGANTVTLTQTILGSFRFAILEYSGVAKTNALDVAAAAQGSSALPSSGTVTTTANGDLLLGGILTAGGESYTPGAGYAIAESEPAEPGTKMIAEYQTPATAGGNSASALLGSTDFWAADLAAFKSAASGGAATPPTTPTPPPPSTPPPPPPLPTIPAITNLNPTSGTAGTLVTIAGTNFGSSMGTVAFNGIEVTPTSWSSTSITAAVPSGATTGNVVVTVGGVASNGVNFNIVTSKGAGIALVQSTGTDASNSSSNALAFGANNTAGNFIAVVIQGGQSGEAFTVTDSQGDTYQQAIQTNEDNARETIAIYYATNIAGGANTVYIFQSVLGSFRIAILEYSGVAKTNALDVAAAAQGASAFPNSGSVTTTASGDLLLGGVMSAGGEFYTASSGYRIEQNVSASPNTRMIAEDQIQASAGPNSAGASLGTTDFWAAVVAAFRPAGGTSSAGSSSGSGSGGSTPPAQGRLSASTANLNFGNISVGTSGLLTDMLSNSGTANVTISNVSISGAGIGTSGVSAGLVLAPGQSAPLNVAFAPTAAVGVSGSVTVSSNAANSPMSITISGAGVEQTSHSADLSWNASSGAVGYNVYRGTVSGGPYALLPGSPITLTTFTDMNVQAGQSYFYAVTSLNSNGVESALSNQAAAKIP